jgi:hypothetical protein
VSGEEILIEKLRAHLHETLQRAQVDEVGLGLVLRLGSGSYG